MLNHKSLAVHEDLGLEPQHPHKSTVGISDPAQVDGGGRWGSPVSRSEYSKEIISKNKVAFNKE